MLNVNDDDIEAFIERNIDIIVACAERGYSGSGAGVVLIYLNEDGGIPEHLHAGYSSGDKLRSGEQIEIAELAEGAKYPDEAVIVLLLPNLQIVDFFTRNIKELQRRCGDPKKPVTFYRSGDLN